VIGWGKLTYSGKWFDVGSSKRYDTCASSTIEKSTNRMLASSSPSATFSDALTSVARCLLPRKPRVQVRSAL